jgi:hypothetical protein
MVRVSPKRARNRTDERDSQVEGRGGRRRTGREHQEGQNGIQPSQTMHSRRTSFVLTAVAVGFTMVSFSIALVINQLVHPPFQMAVLFPNPGLRRWPRGEKRLVLQNKRMSATPHAASANASDGREEGRKVWSGARSTQCGQHAHSCIRETEHANIWNTQDPNRHCKTPAEKSSANATDSHHWEQAGPWTLDSVYIQIVSPNLRHVQDHLELSGISTQRYAISEGGEQQAV